jgi:hypothetical protein
MTGRTTTNVKWWQKLTWIGELKRTIASHQLLWFYTNKQEDGYSLPELYPLACGCGYGALGSTPG